MYSPSIFFMEKNPLNTHSSNNTRYIVYTDTLGI